MSWIIFALLAALMQAFRTAGQKQLARSISAHTVTYVRFIFGLPLVMILAFVLKQHYQYIHIDSAYVMLVFTASICQILGTYLSILLLGRRNFVTGSTLVKSETMFAAILGVVIFSQHLHSWAWLALILNMFGILMVSIFKKDISVANFISSLDSKSAYIGLLAGLFFAMAALFIREATLSLTMVMESYAKGIFVLLCMLTIQTGLSLAIIFVKQPYVLKEMSSNFSSCVFIGMTSMLGSAGWFIAYSMQNVAYVKIVGQIEFLFISLITIYYFKESVSRYEWLGALLIVLSIVILFLP